MKTVTQLAQIRRNMETIDKYLQSRVDPEYSFALSRIKRGICFIALRHSESEGYKFYPSRFIGYISNTMKSHQNNDDKDGRITNGAIAKVLGCKPSTDPVLDKYYIDWCDELGFVANNKGAYGTKRKFWLI